MFWNSEFNCATSSVFDDLLQSESTKLSDILFHEELLLELKTFNLPLTNYLSKPEIVNELLDNICNLTEKDCYDKLLYSKVHAAYISCEILTIGSSQINASLSQDDSLKRIISCLVKQPDDDDGEGDGENEVTDGADADDNHSGEVSEEKIDSNNLKTNGIGEKAIDQIEEDQKEEKQEHEQKQELEQEQKQEEKEEKEEQQQQQEQEEQQEPQENSTSPNPTNPEPDTKTEPEETKVKSELDEPKKDEEQAQPQSIDEQELPASNESAKKHNKPPKPISSIKVVPQKAALVSKLIRSIHSNAPANLSCLITKNIDIFSSLIEVLVNNIDVSGSYEILGTFLGRTRPVELRYVFCEILSKLNFVFSLIDVMTLSNVEDKQRNACQLLCDIIVTGRQEINENIQCNSRQHPSVQNSTAQDMLAELTESKEVVHRILSQMFSQKNSKEPIVCGMKVIQTLVEQKHAKNNTDLVMKTVEKIQDEIAENLFHFHELLKNPPEQEPIKMTFGVIQKPLGYIRLEVVSLIRELLSTCSPVIIRKLVELKTFKIIIDLFVEYSWNNLLHTQVEQAVHLIIKNCRRDEDLKYQVDVQKLSENDTVEEQPTPQVNHDLPSLALLSQLLNECELIFRLLYPRKDGEQANFGHIIQMINSLSINRDLDSIKDHLNEMKNTHPETYARWTNFVNVDVASFKAISLYFDVQSVSNQTHSNNFELLSYQRNLTANDDHGHYLTSFFEPNHHRSPTANSDDNVADDKIMTYFSFTKETVIPTINVDVLPKPRRGGALL